MVRAMVLLVFLFAAASGLTGSASCSAIAGPSATSTAPTEAACTFEPAANSVRVRADAATLDHIGCSRIMGLGGCSCSPFTWCVPLFPVPMTGTIEATVIDASGRVLAQCRAHSGVASVPRNCEAESIIDSTAVSPFTCVVKVTGRMSSSGTARCTSAESGAGTTQGGSI